MVGESGPRRSRRAILAAAGSGLALLAAESLTGPPAAQAADFDNVRLGTTNTSGHQTAIDCSGPKDTGAALWVHHPAGTGIGGGSTDGVGLLGTSTSDFGVMGASDSSDGVHGDSQSGVGVQGGSLGALPGGAGVRGDCADGTGVHGQTISGIGVHGLTTGTGSATVAVAATAAKGTALRVDGSVQFSSAGLGTIPKLAARGTVFPAVALSASSKVLVTLMSNPGAALLKWVQVAPASRKSPSHFVVYLTRKCSADVAFAWFVIS